MALKIYGNYPFTAPIGLVDVFAGTGAVSLFNFTNLTAQTVGPTIQFDLVPYTRILGGFSTPTNSSFQLASTPPLNAQGIAPSNIALTFPVFDQAIVPGTPNPTSANVIDVPFWLADDGNGIVSQEYIPMPGAIGIPLFFQNMVTAAGASVAWTQLACANPDGSLTVSNYAATGTTLYTAQYIALTTLSASAASLATTIVVAAASGFYAGDYIFLNPGGGTQETVGVTAINYGTNTLTITGINYNHFSGENVFMLGRKFWARCTLPVGTLNGSAANYYNLVLSFQAAIASRF